MGGEGVRNVLSAREDIHEVKRERRDKALYLLCFVIKF